MPNLNPDRLKLLIQQIKANKRLSAAGKRAAILSLEAAANPNAEDPRVVIATLPDERRRSVETTMQVLTAFSKNIVGRGRVALQNMTEAEWQALVEAGDE